MESYGGPDENDSPFAHVPVPEAGPNPLQEGTFTYDKLIASAGHRAPMRGQPRARTVVVWIAGVMLLAAVLVPLVIALVR